MISQAIFKTPKQASAVTYTLIVMLIAVCPGVSGDSFSKDTWDGIYSAEQAQRGQSVYAVNCASCHGPQLNGIDAAPALNGGSFYANWNGVSLRDMANRIRISMPQNNPGSLSRNQVADVMAYVFSRNGFPAGQKELPKRPAYLTHMLFRSSDDRAR